jgi:hypothetical protein
MNTAQRRRRIRHDAPQVRILGTTSRYWSTQSDHRTASTRSTGDRTTFQVGTGAQSEHEHATPRSATARTHLAITLPGLGP